MNVEETVKDIHKRLSVATDWMSVHRPDHPLFQELINVGEPAVDVLVGMLRDSTAEQGNFLGVWWIFMALRVLTGCNPIKPGHSGRLSLIFKDWLDWDSAGRPNFVSGAKIFAWIEDKEGRKEGE